MYQKLKIEIQKTDEIDKSDKALTEKIKKINSNAQQMIQKHFETDTPINKKEEHSNNSQSMLLKKEQKQEKRLAK